jgi:hypothetical protein
MKPDHVFINCPFDTDYQLLFEAMIFTVFACGFVPRCALEEADAANLRLSKILELINDCEKSIHDLSRTEVGESGLPRFNMPFELGLMMGAKHFGGKKNRKKSALVLVKDKYSLPSYMSDMGGNDPSHHEGRPEAVVEIVRHYLSERPQGGPVPGKKHIFDGFSSFNNWLPLAAGEAGLDFDEVSAFRHYRTYSHFVTEYLRNRPVL